MRRAFLLLLLVSFPAAADTVVLKSGLRIVGKSSVWKGRILVEGAGGKRWSFSRSEVARIEKGESLLEQYDARAAALPKEDAQGWFKLGLWAQANHLACAADAFREVLRIDPDHRAARRALGYERVGKLWLTHDAAMRKKGFVLAGGNYVLPEEADALLAGKSKATAPATAEDRARAQEIATALCDDDPEVRDAARGMLRAVPREALVRPMKRVLFAPRVKTRLFAANTLGSIGDRVAVPWLLESSIYDSAPSVRAASVAAAKQCGGGDVFFPLARAIFSKDLRVSIRAAQALSQLGDARGVGVLLKKVEIGIGTSPRVNVFIGTQQSYVGDFDVEVAQAAAIGDPIVHTIRDGVLLDAKVLGGHGEAYIAQARTAYADALAHLTGRDYGTDFGKYRSYAEEVGIPTAPLR